MKFNLLRPSRNRFQHEVKVTANSVDRAGAEIEIGQLVTVGVGKIGHSCVEMDSATIADNFAERQICFKSSTTNSETFMRIAGGNNDSQTRRERWQAIGFHDR